MKKILFSIIISLLMILSFNAQTTPQGMKYQAVARDLSGEIIANQPISLKIKLQSELNSPTIYFTEIHNVTTNQFGLFSLIVGQGNIEKGVFNEIPWETRNIWIDIAMKTDEENDYTSVSISKLLTVPYAFHAATASKISAGNEIKGGGGVPSQNWSLFGNSKSDPEKDKLGTTDDADLVLVTNDEERMRIFSNGDINMKKSLSIDENLTVAKNVYLNTVEGETINNGPFTVENQSLTLLTGDLHVNGFSQFDSNINIDASTVTDMLVVTDEVSPDPIPRFGSLADVRGLFVADSIAIRGGVDIGGNLKVHGDSVVVDHHLVVGGMSKFRGQVTINANVTGGEADYDAYPLRVEGSDQGIAIKVNQGTPSNSNNFVTFFDNNNTVRGRIEGETSGELATNPEYIFDQVIFASDFLINSGSLIAATAELVQAGVDQVAADVSITTCVGAGVGIGGVAVAVECLPIASLIGASITDIICKLANEVIAIANEAEAIANPIAYNVFKFTQIGVTYQSGAGDYAEWLPKDNLSDKFYPGDLVAVKAGKISHNTVNAENIMVVSSNPIVLGNMPEEELKATYEKVAFMGQVPVKVRGIVKEGDYILPSGNNDGFGIAKSPESLVAADYQKIVGIAWSSSNSTQLNYVNVAVGINANDVTRLVVKQANEIDELKTRLNKIDILLAKMDVDKVKAVQTDIQKIDNTEDGVNESEPRTVTYRKIKIEQIEEGIISAKKQLSNSDVDIDNHPFFKKLESDPDYKMKLINRILGANENEINRRAEIDRKEGLNVLIE